MQTADAITCASYLLICKLTRQQHCCCQGEAKGVNNAHPAEQLSRAVMV
jgi:hypothetical protein